MEDIIPIFIVVLLLGEVPEVKAQLDMIVDFIEFDTCDLESERRLLLNLSVPLSPHRNPSTSSTATGKFDPVIAAARRRELYLLNGPLRHY